MSDAKPDPANGTRLAVDFGTPLVVEIPGVEGKIKCPLVGMQPGEFLILRPPKAHAYKLFHIGKSPRAVVRYIYSGRVFGFETALLGAILDPLGLIFLAYPRQISEHNLRAAPRVDCHLPATATLDDVALDGAVEDISPTGCRLSLATASLQALRADVLNLGIDIRIDLQLPNQSAPLNLYGKVKNLEQDARRVALGIAFTEIGAAARAQITRYLTDG